MNIWCFNAYKQQQEALWGVNFKYYSVDVYCYKRTQSIPVEG